MRSGINKIPRFITYLLWPTGLLIIYTQLFTTNVGWRESVLRMVGALVPMVPEGLVLMTSIAFAVGVVRLGRRQCLVQELPAIEGLAGSTWSAPTRPAPSPRTARGCPRSRR